MSFSIAIALRERTGKTQGIQLSITPPMNANAKFIRNSITIMQTTPELRVKELAEIIN
ncbi:hypothetical protein [Wolbachia endosymbiont of Folsomia candida]|uniref:hypothetical protein n=1 Tax=Wolbachia endosymbiont of Folsomia candida TaxID=169402 RepID=UPI0013001809|nr:hypothetical protein [Wolbachia endosymbiont of Folsomia candida]